MKGEMKKKNVSQTVENINTNEIWLYSETNVALWQSEMKWLKKMKLSNEENVWLTENKKKIQEKRKLHTYINDIWNENVSKWSSEMKKMKIIN